METKKKTMYHLCDLQGKCTLSLFLSYLSILVSLTKCCLNKMFKVSDKDEVKYFKTRSGKELKLPIH